MKYRIYYAGKPAINDGGVSLAKAVFTEPYESCDCDGSTVTVTFQTPQTPTDLGPLVKIERWDDETQAWVSAT